MEEDSATLSCVSLPYGMVLQADPLLCRELTKPLQFKHRQRHTEVPFTMCHNSILSCYPYNFRDSFSSNVFDVHIYVQGLAQGEYLGHVCLEIPVIYFLNCVIGYGQTQSMFACSGIGCLYYTANQLLNIFRVQIGSFDLFSLIARCKHPIASLLSKNVDERLLVFRHTPWLMCSQLQEKDAKWKS